MSSCQRKRVDCSAILFEETRMGQHQGHLVDGDKLGDWRMLFSSSPRQARACRAVQDATSLCRYPFTFCDPWHGLPDLFFLKGRPTQEFRIEASPSSTRISRRSPLRRSPWVLMRRNTGKPEARAGAPWQDAPGTASVSLR